MKKKISHKELPRVITLNSSYFYKGELVRVRSLNKGIAKVENLFNCLFEVKVSGLEDPPRCIWQGKRISLFCLCKDEESDDCLSYFCKSKSYVPVTGNFF